MESHREWHIQIFAAGFTRKRYEKGISTCWQLTLWTHRTRPHALEVRVIFMATHKQKAWDPRTGDTAFSTGNPRTRTFLLLSNMRNSSSEVNGRPSSMAPKPPRTQAPAQETLKSGTENTNVGLPAALYMVTRTVFVVLAFSITETQLFPFCSWLNSLLFNLQKVGKGRGRGRTVSVDQGGDLAAAAVTGRGDAAEIKLVVEFRGWVLGHKLQPAQDLVGKLQLQTPPPPFRKAKWVPSLVDDTFVNQ
jgi:hypothetical protein